jgi:hypothetical protein
MERPLEAIEGYGLMLCVCSETLEEYEGRALQQVAWAIRGEADKIKQLRGHVLDGLRNSGGKVCIAKGTPS